MECGSKKWEVEKELKKAETDETQKISFGVFMIVCGGGGGKAANRLKPE